MIIKCIEIRDRLTCIPAVAIKMEAADVVEAHFLRRCGYPQDGTGVVLMKLSDQEASSDPYHWDNRTMGAAHLFIEESFDDLVNGQVVDARVYLKECAEPAEPEIMTRAEAQ